MPSSRPRGAALGAAALAAVAVAVSGCAAADPNPTGVITKADDGWAGAALDEPYEVAGANLRDTEGEAYSLTRSTDAPVTLVFFGYTHCPDICQMVLSNVASAKLRLPQEQRDEVDVVLVTTDPARDDEQAMRRYLDRFDPSFIGLTGDLKTINRIGSSVAVFIAKGTELDSGGYDVEHNDHVVAITEDDRVPLLWTREASAADIATDLERLLSEETG